jgi:hypothetical protein
MLRDGILEESYSAYVNPLTLVHCEPKHICICVEVRRINIKVVANRVSAQPMCELLQRFHGSSLDLRSLFLQMPLNKGSRKWTAFQLHSRLYKIKSVKYGFKTAYLIVVDFLKFFGSSKETLGIPEAKNPSLKLELELVYM